VVKYLDTNLLLSVTALIVSLVGTITATFYSKRNVDVLRDELNILKNEQSKKEEFEETAKAVKNLLDSIEESTRSNFFTFPSLLSLRDNIVRYLYDKKQDKIELLIRPVYVKCYFEIENKNESKVEEAIFTKLDPFNKFKAIFEGRFHSAVFYFELKPQIIDNRSVDLSDCLLTIKEMRNSLKDADKYRQTVERFDRNVLLQFNHSLNNIIESIYNNLMQEDHVVVFENTKSDDIYFKLLESFVGYKSIKEEIKLIQSEYSKTLSRVLQDLYDKS
jgi:hypothetical protein